MQERKWNCAYPASAAYATARSSFLVVTKVAGKAKAE